MLIALFVVLLWATSWVLIKVGLEEIPALLFAGLRYTLAFLCLLPLAIFRHHKEAFVPQSRRSVGQLLALGLLLYTVTQGAIFLALAYLPAITVNLLWSFSTVAVAALGIFTLAEEPTRFQWSGIALALLGAMIYFFPAGLIHGHFIGIVVSIIGVFANAGASILGRGVNRTGEIQPLIVTTISMGVGSVTLLMIGLLTHSFPIISARGWAIIAWLAVVNTAFAFTLWNYTLRTLSATESSIINGTMIIWIPILAIVFLGETITPKELVGLVAVGIGTLFVQLRSPLALSQIIRIRK